MTVLDHFPDNPLLALFSLEDNFTAHVSHTCLGWQVRT